MAHRLVFENVSKDFPGVRALEKVSFSLREREIHGLVGENGAGKSTLIGLLGGAYRPTSGRILLEGREKVFENPRQALLSSIAVIHQELNLVPEFTVAENLFLGKWETNGLFLSKKKMNRQCQDFLAECGIELESRRKVANLTMGQCQMVEIAKALMRNARVLALDEPTSSLSDFEVEILFRLVKRLRDEGKSLIYVSHRMSEIFELCDRCTILRDGSHIATYDNLEKLDRSQLVTSMTGRKIDDIYHYRQRSRGEKLLSVHDLAGVGCPHPLRFELHKGEILGFFGLVGSGRSEAMRLIVGDQRITCGHVELEGKTLKLHSPKSAIVQGIMYCSEDRKREGIIAQRPVAENITLSCRRHFLRWGFVNAKKERAVTKEQILALSIKTSSPDQLIDFLSGGNQQKVILSRWLAEKNMKILIMDEPTRGIDVGAKSEIYQIIYDLADQGVGVIVISSELPEIMGICDRILVMREKVLVGEIPRGNYSEKEILHLAFPSHQEAG